MKNLMEDIYDVIHDSRHHHSASMQRSMRKKLFETVSDGVLADCHERFISHPRLSAFYDAMAGNKVLSQTS